MWSRVQFAFESSPSDEELPAHFLHQMIRVSGKKNGRGKGYCINRCGGQYFCSHQRFPAFFQFLYQNPGYFCILKRSLETTALICPLALVQFAVSSVGQNPTTQNTKNGNKCFNKSERGLLCSLKMLARKLNGERVKEVMKHGLETGRARERIS